MVKALFDTNVLIDYLNGIDAAEHELARYASKAISVITWMEVLAGTSQDDDADIQDWLSSFEVIGLDAAIASRAVSLRRKHRIRLPDAVIWATAQTRSLILVTRNSTDFPADDPGVRQPYTLQG